MTTNQQKEIKLGFDPASPDGDYGVEVYGYYKENGQVVITRVETLVKANQQNRESWEEEFDKQFGLTFVPMNVKQFIRSTRKSAAQEAREEVLMEVIEIVEKTKNFEFSGWNSALDEVLSKLQQLTTN